MYPVIKRMIDVCVSLVLGIALAPVMGVIALAVRIVLGRPILFRQIRPGLDGKPFTLYKFRSMSTAAREDVPDEDRLSAFGIWLRSTSLDELPTLWNVLRGDMSLVGPRPLLMEYMPLYTPEQAKRHLVRPGVTGLAQVNGRNALSWEEKFALDVWYAEHQSLWLDIKIAALTLWKVVRREGVSQPGRLTAERFRGSDA